MTGADTAGAAAERLVVLAEGFSADAHYGKTGRGIRHYGRRPVVAIVDSERAGERDDDVPVVADIDEALEHGPTTAVIGVAPQGGRLPLAWRRLVEQCLERGVAVESGLHDLLADDPDLRALAARTGAEIRDLRRSPEGLGCPTGANLGVRSRIALTVGSDCAIGKMTVSLELEAEARKRGLAALFVPTGQTGIAIAGWGIAVDAVVSDFVAGAAERLVVEGEQRGGTDLLLVEGQGAITHPAYASVTLGLLHGAVPHVLVLCHKAGTTEVEGYPGHPILPLPRLVALYESVALPRRPARVACVALNTSDLDDAAARDAIATVMVETGLPTDDPVRFGRSRLLAAILES
jgi:uncharacterized NAD-dependent epimerase/dehydratase family protein